MKAFLFLNQKGWYYYRKFRNSKTKSRWDDIKKCYPAAIAIPYLSHKLLFGEGNKHNRHCPHLYCSL